MADSGSDSKAVVSMRKGFADPAYAMRLRDSMKKLAEDQMGGLGEGQQVGRCTWVDLGKLKASVWLPGDPEPIPVELFSDSIPNDVGDSRTVPGAPPTSDVGPGAIVIIETIRSKKYITRILSGGQFGFKAEFAGLSHKLFNTTHVVPQLLDTSVPAQGIFGTSFSFFLPTFVEYGDAAIVGPMTGISDGAFLGGQVRMIVSQDQETRIYEFSLNSDELNSQELPESGTRWLRLLPARSHHANAGINFEICVDIGIRDTGIIDKKTGREIWLRFSTLIPGDYIDFTWVHVEGIGPISKFGDPNTGRILVEDESPAQPISGYLGFHTPIGSVGGAYGGRVKEQELLYTAEAPFYPEHAWSGGPWRDASLRLAGDLFKLWGCTGAFYWDGTKILWTGDIVLTGVGPMIHGLVEGRVNIPMPPNGTLIPVMPSTWTGVVDSMGVRVTSGMIPLAAGQTLYIKVPPSMGNGTFDGESDFTPSKYLVFIVDNESLSGFDANFKLPEWAIPIAHRSYTGLELQEVRLTSHTVELFNGNQTQQQNSSTSGVAVGTSEVAVHTFGTFRFKAQSAYRVRTKQMFQGTATTQAVMFRIRKGTVFTTDWSRWGYNAVNVANQPFSFYGEQVLVNNTSADINTQFMITAIATAAGPTLIRDATTRAWADIEYIGPGARYQHGVSIT